MIITRVSAPTKEYRCPSCKALLFRGLLVGDIKCYKCGYLTRFDFDAKKRILFLALCAELAQTVTS